MKRGILFLVLCFSLSSCVNTTPKNKAKEQPASWYRTEMMATYHVPESRVTHLLKSKDNINKKTKMVEWINISRN